MTSTTMTTIDNCDNDKLCLLFAHVVAIIKKSKLYKTKIYLCKKSLLFFAICKRDILTISVRDAFVKKCSDLTI